MAMPSASRHIHSGMMWPPHRAKTRATPRRLRPVHMAQAHAELTGELGVALVTAGPGVTNAITGIATVRA
jgi:hypothetical protein